MVSRFWNSRDFIFFEGHQTFSVDFRSGEVQMGSGEFKASHSFSGQDFSSFRIIEYLGVIKIKEFKFFVNYLKFFALIIP